MGNLTREDALDDVGAIEAVHAVCAHDTYLSALDATCLTINQLSLTEANVELGHEVSITHQFLLDNSDELAKVLPLHILALSMEIEPDVFNVFVFKRLCDLRHFFANTFLATLFVDKIDEILFCIVSLGLFYVLLCSLQRLIKVGRHSDGRCPLHVRLHSPQQGNGAAYLKVARYSEAPARLSVHHNMLSLAEVGRVALTIEPTYDEAAAHASSIFARD